MTNPQPTFLPCHGCGLPMIVAPAKFYGRDHSGRRDCDGLFATPYELAEHRYGHFRRNNSVEVLREWLRQERERYA